MFTRWRDLTAKLPPNSRPFLNGWYRIDYALEGDLKETELHRFQDVLGKAITRNTGWLMFWIPTREESAPRELDGVIECWLAPKDSGVDR
ncbi:hypothetical protein JIR23_14250 [Bradyrhizobium diazoefficiens]|nr:hypothetical protein [Bradyrhizobium diazoefficiens]QQN66757.1 hypothetical protein JIR23_14250 [Bradyrhizobium diazoefficiens]